MINDLYDKIQEIEKNGGSGNGGGVSSNGGQTSTERTPVMPRSTVATSQSRAGLQTVKEINETLRVMKDRIDAMAG